MENEAEGVRATMLNAVQHIRHFVEEVTDWGRKLGHTIQSIEGGFQIITDVEGAQRTVPVRTCQGRVSD